jgi:hypothetical protein
MNTPKLFYRLSFSLFVLAVVGLFVPPTAFCQTEKLGIVRYIPSISAKTKLETETDVRRLLS